MVTSGTRADRTCLCLLCDLKLLIRLFRGHSVILCDKSNMPVVGFPTTLESVLNTLVSQPGLSSYKIAANPDSTTVVLRFTNMADGQGLTTVEPTTCWRKKSASQLRRDRTRFGAYIGMPPNLPPPQLSSTFKNVDSENNSDKTIFPHTTCSDFKETKSPC